MAFHPLRTFQKNRKFWMASILLMCMGTFVLCTGLQGGGDFGDWLLRILTGRRGIEVTELDGRTIYSGDIEELKQQRDVANEFMRKAAQLTLERARQRFDDTGKTKDDAFRKARLILLERLMADLTGRLAKPRYFGDTKVNTLVDFIVLRNQADRLGINLTDQAVVGLLHDQIHGWALGFDSDASRSVELAVRSAMSRNVTYGMMMDALRQEFRVAIARRALEECPAKMIFVEDKQRGRQEQNFLYDWPVQARMPVSPEQMHTFYKQHRAEAEVALIPIPVERFIKDIKSDPERIKAFFDKYKKDKYDPSREEPGFEIPERAEIVWVSADPTSKFYRQAAQTVLALQVTPLCDPNLPLTLTAAGYGARAAAWEQRLMKDYDRHKLAAEAERSKKYLLKPLTDPYFALPLFTSIKEPTVFNTTALVGGSALPQFGPSAIAGYQTAAYLRQRKELLPVLTAVREKRAPIGATLVFTAAMQPSSAADLMSHLAAGVPQYLPLVGALKEELTRKVETSIAQEWVNANMRAVQKKLDSSRRRGDRDLFTEILEQAEGRYGLTRGGTKGLRNRFDIDKDPGMEPLKKAYEDWYAQVNLAEGLAGTAGNLGGDDIYKLFFGGGTFSVGNTEAYHAKTWPPTVTLKKQLELGKQEDRPQSVNFFLRATRPFLFWRTNHTPSRVPGSLEEVYDTVEHAWKVKEARDGMKPRLKQVADALQAVDKKDGDVRAAIRKAAKDVGGQWINLQHVAPWVEEKKGNGQVVNFVPYALPKGKILYPQDNTAKLILALTNLTKPLETGHKELDDLNRELFKDKGKGKVIQVFANRPRTVFYVAVLMHEPRLGAPALLARSLDDSFYSTYYMGSGQIPEDFRNPFVTRCQEEIGRTYREELRLQMRTQAGFHGITKEAEKQYESDNPK